MLDRRGLFKLASAAVALPDTPRTPASDSQDLKLAGIAVAGRDFGLPALGDAQPALQALVDRLGERGGGRVELAADVVRLGATLDVRSSRVVLEGLGADLGHDAGRTGSRATGTVLLPTFAGTAVRVGTPPGAGVRRITGSGLRGLSIVGNGRARRLLEIDSVAAGDFDVYLENAVGDEAALVTCGRTGLDVAEAADTSHNRFRLRFRQFDGAAAQACGCLVIDGSATANPCYNDFWLAGQHVHGAAIDIRNADNNTFHRPDFFRAPGGRGQGAVNRAGLEARFARDNLFIGPSLASLIFEGVSPGRSASTGVVLARDLTNSTPAPVIGPGCIVNEIGALPARQLTPRLLGLDGGEVAAVSRQCALKLADGEASLHGVVQLAASGPPLGGLRVKAPYRAAFATAGNAVGEDDGPPLAVAMAANSDEIRVRVSGPGRLAPGSSITYAIRFAIY